MANHDPISDMLTRIRNASEKRHESTKVPASRMSRSIAKVLQQEGFIAEISEQGEGVRTELVLDSSTAANTANPPFAPCNGSVSLASAFTKTRAACPRSSED
jgi:small subunit ribosomal protein S8